MGLVVTVPRTALAFGLFLPHQLQHYGLFQSDVVLLKWFIQYASTGKMMRREPEGPPYFWVDYDNAAQNLFTSPRTIRRSFSRLCDAPPGYPPPLLKSRVPNLSRQGSRCFFMLTREFIETVVPLEIRGGSAMSKITGSCKLLEADLSPESRVVNREIIDIIEGLLLIHQRGSRTPKLFTNRFPGRSDGYSKTIIGAAERLWSVYEGRFFREYRVDPKFIDRNAQYITPGTRDKIKGVRGSWEAVSRLVFEAARNYRQWWWPENEPENKDWLQPNITWWLFDQYTSSSVFLACVDRGPDRLRELTADRIWAGLPDGIPELAERLRNPDWDARVFWARVRDVVEWYTVHRRPLEDRDSNACYWFDGGVAAWFGRYVQWLTDLSGANGKGLWLKNIGVGCPTWEAWYTHAARAHNIRVSLSDAETLAAECRS